MVLSGQSSAGEPLGQGSIPLLQPGARKLEGLGQLQSQGTRHCFGGHRPSEAGARLGHSPECGQDVHGPWQGQAGLWVLGIGPAVASVEHGLNVPAADMGPGWNGPGRDKSQGCPQGLGNSAKVFLKFRL